MLVCRNLAWWRQEQRVWTKTKFGGAHPQRFNVWRWESCLERGQWAGMRLHRTSASGKLVKEHFSLRVADFVWTRVLKSRGHSDSDGFLFLRETAVSVSCCVGEAGPLLLSGHAHFT